MTTGETYPAGQITVKGLTLEIKTDDEGRWLAWLNGQEVKSESKEKLKAAIARAIRASATTVAVQFVAEHGKDGTRRGVGTGLHAGTKRVLITWEDGEKGQAERWGGGKYLPGDTDPDEWARLRKAAHAAARELYAFEQARKFDLADAVRKAVAEAVAGPDEDSGQ